MLGTLKKELLTFLVRSEYEALRLSSAKFRYQPSAVKPLIPCSDRANGTRPCSDRLEAILRHVPADGKNMLDIGSNAGYYLFEFAKRGYASHGLETDPDLVHFTALASYVLGIEHVSCELGRLDRPYVQRMKPYDVVLCLSVIHHIIMETSFENAEAILRGLAANTNKALFFEMGQSNELMADWSPKLPKMEPDPEQWISAWLLRCGFRKTEVIGTSTTTVPRLIFIAYP
jgi:SAM-dependent methyltransferase